jgi:hypothetical protein
MAGHIQERGKRKNGSTTWVARDPDGGSEGVSGTILWRLSPLLRSYLRTASIRRPASCFCRSSTEERAQVGPRRPLVPQEGKRRLSSVREYPLADPGLRSRRAGDTRPSRPSDREGSPRAGLFVRVA